MKKTILVFVALFITLTVYGQDCPRYADLMKKAKNLWTNGEFEMALNQLNAAREHCPIKSTEIDKQLIKFTNEISRKYQEANQERENTEISKKNAEEQTLIAKLAQKNAENALSIADSLTRVHLETLDSLGDYSKKEFYFEKFNSCKKNADIFFIAQVWDSSYFSYKNAIEAVDASPYIQVNKKYLYDRIEICIEKIIEQRNIYEMISKGDSLAKVGGFVNYATSFDLFFEVSNNENFKGDITKHMVEISNSIERDLGDLNKNNYKNIDQSKYPLAQLFFDLNNYLEIKEGQNGEIESVLKKSKVKRIVRKNYNKFKIVRRIKTIPKSRQPISPVEIQIWNPAISNFFSVDDFNNKINKNYSINSSWGLIFHSNSKLISDSSKLLKHRWLNNFYSGSGVLIRSIGIRSTLIDTINIAIQNGSVVNINNAKKITDNSITNFGLFKSYDFVSNKIRILNNIKVNIGLNLGGEVTLESYSETRTNIFLDSLTFSPQIIENNFVTAVVLDKDTRAYVSLFSSGYIKCIYENKKNLKTCFGVRISNLTPLHTKRQKKIYSELREKNGIIGGASLNTFELTIGFHIDF